MANLEKLSVLLLLLAAANAGPSHLAMEAAGLPPHLTVEDFEAACQLDDAELAQRNENPPGGGPGMPIMEIGEQFADEKHFTVSGMWKDGGVPYTVSGFDATDRAAIAKAIAHLQSVSGIRFVPGKAGDARLLQFVASGNAGGACWTTFAFYGFHDVKATVSLPPRTQCTLPRTVIHEIFHALGHFHTHQRLDRDDHIAILHENYHSSKREEFKKCVVPQGQSSNFYCNVFGQPYECDSVMHYASNQFSINGQDTIVSKHPSDCVLRPYPEWNAVEPYLSPGDVARLREQYGAPRGSGVQDGEEEQHRREAWRCHERKGGEGSVNK